MSSFCLALKTFHQLRQRHTPLGVLAVLYVARVYELRVETERALEHYAWARAMSRKCGGRGHGADGVRTRQIEADIARILKRHGGPSWVDLDLASAA
jgi:hypothetical protein